jgi:hypothetical protein
MHLLAVLVVAIQLFFVVHVLRTGRQTYWVFIILAAPVIGCVAYYFVEIFPSTRESAKAERAINRAIAGIGKGVDPTKALRERAADVETCGSVDNRIALARECLDHGLADDALKVLQSCLSGPFVNDPHLRLLLVQAALAAHQHDAGFEHVDVLRSQHPSFKPAEVGLLAARLHEDAGRTEAALSAYAEVLPSSSGEETRVRYAMLLARAGQPARARELLQTTLSHAERQNAGYRDLHREWIAAARRELTALG